MPPKPVNDHSFQEYLDQEKLMGSRCLACGALYAPPRSICIGCHSSEMEWRELKGSGRLAAFTVISVVPPRMAALGYGRDRPYCSGVVELEEGGRVDAFIVGLDLGRPEEIAVGTPLRVRYLHGRDGNGPETRLAFEPA